MDDMVAELPPALGTHGKVVGIQAWRGDQLVAVYPAKKMEVSPTGKVYNRGPRKRMSATKIKNVMQWFKEHHGEFEQFYDKATDSWMYREKAPYVRFVKERVYQ